MDTGFLLRPPTPSTDPTSAHPSKSRSAKSHGARAHVAMRRLKAKEHLFFEGSHADDVYEIAQGAILLVRSLPEGRRQIVDVIGPGRIFGLTSRSRHLCSAIASVPTLVHALPTAAMIEDPVMSQRCTRGALAEIDRLRELALALGRKTAIERLAGFLLSLVGSEAVVSAEVHLPLTRAELADHLGLTFETVSRNTTRLKKMRLIGDDYGDRLRIFDCGTLRDIAEGRAPEGGMEPSAADIATDRPRER